MEAWNSLPSRVRQIIAGIGIFAVGAAFSFGYSYRPLHGSLTFQVEALEERLDERNRENLQLKDKLEGLEKDETTRIEPETLAQVESELAKTKSALKGVEKKVETAERKRRDANATADRWRKRFESLRDQQQAMPAVKDPSPADNVAKPTPASSGPTQDALSLPTGAAPSTPQTQSLPMGSTGLPDAREASQLQESDSPILP